MEEYAVAALQSEHALARIGSKVAASCRDSNYRRLSSAGHPQIAPVKSLSLCGCEDLSNCLSVCAVAYLRVGHDYCKVVL